MARLAVRKCLALPHDVVNAYFHANVKDGGLSIPSMRWLMPLQRRLRLERQVIRGEQIPDFLLQELGIVRRRLTVGRDDLNTDRKLEQRWAALLHGSSDGKGLKDSRKVPQQHRWVTEGTRSLSGRDFINIMKLRINALPTKSRTSRGRIADRSCRAGCGQVEAINHILQVCHRTHGTRIQRHNAVVAFVKRDLAKTCDRVVEEPRLQTPAGLRKPDLLAIRERKAIVIDAQVVSEQADLERAHGNKIEYYRNLEGVIKNIYDVSEVEFTSATLSSRGVWSKSSAEDLLKWRILGKNALKIISTRVLVGGLNSFWFYGRTTSMWPRSGVG